jgi:hypothetical protein
MSLQSPTYSDHPIICWLLCTVFALPTPSPCLLLRRLFLLLQVGLLLLDLNSRLGLDEVLTQQIGKVVVDLAETKLLVELGHLLALLSRVGLELGLVGVPEMHVSLIINGLQLLHGGHGSSLVGGAVGQLDGALKLVENGSDGLSESESLLSLGRSQNRGVSGVLDCRQGDGSSLEHVCDCEVMYRDPKIH